MAAIGESRLILESAAFNPEKSFSANVPYGRRPGSFYRDASFYQDPRAATSTVSVGARHVPGSPSPLRGGGTVGQRLQFAALGRADEPFRGLPRSAALGSG